MGLTVHYAPTVTIPVMQKNSSQLAITKTPEAFKNLPFISRKFGHHTENRKQRQKHNEMVGKLLITSERLTGCFPDRNSRKSVLWSTAFAVIAYSILHVSFVLVVKQH